MATFAVTSAQDSVERVWRGQGNEEERRRHGKKGHDDVHHHHSHRPHGDHRPGEMKPDAKSKDELTGVLPGAPGSGGEEGGSGEAVKEAIKFTARQQLYLLLEDPDSSFSARVCSHFILYTIVASVACFVLETHPSLRDAYTFKIVEPATTIIFTLEYVTRFLVCDAFPPSCYGHQSKCDFLRNPLNILDFLAFAPFYLEVAAEELMKNVKPLRVLRSVRLIRCFRIFKLSKYSLGMTIMVESVMNSVQPLTILTFFLGIGVVLTSSLMYYAERTGCPDVKAMIANNTYHQYRKDCYEEDTGWSPAGKTSYHGDGLLLCCNEKGSALDFPSIHGSFWWSVVTMTTVGYGDHVPRTLPGKLVGCLAMLSGIVLISLPVAIVGSKFQLAYESIEEEKRQLLSLDEDEREALLQKTGGHGREADLLAEIANTGAEAQVEKEEAKKDRQEAPPSSDFGNPSPVARPSSRELCQFDNVRHRLKSLEHNEKLSDKAVDELYQLLEMFDHVERVEGQLKKLRDKDTSLDASIRKEFASLSRAYDLSLREKGLH